MEDKPSCSFEVAEGRRGALHGERNRLSFDKNFSAQMLTLGFLSRG